MEEILVVENLVKSFAGLRAINNISLRIREGRVYGVIGPNGSGKSTLFNLISGVLKPDAGRIYFMGKRIDGLPPHEIYQMGIARSFQIPTLFFKMRVVENMLLPPKRQKGEMLRYAPIQKSWAYQELYIAGKTRDIMEDLKLVNVYRNQASEVSGGQMKLLEIGRTMMAEPRLVLLDEPTAGIAPTLAEEIFKIIKSLSEQYNLTFIVIEHRYDILFQYAEYIFLLNEGALAAEGPPNQLLNNPILAQVYLGD
ncbi:MAG: ABC transporter ATP-binding protein [Nitrososphaerota archaeon]